MQKIGTKKLRMSGHDIMGIAEKLYTNGFISYPRTETDQFDNSINLRQLVANLTQFGDSKAQTFTHNLLEGGGFEQPRKGNSNDGAHPPIHPVKAPTSLNDREIRVYNLVAKHFLACCSKDAVAEGTKVDISVGPEQFKANGTVVLQRNYLDIYQEFEQWNDKEIPEFKQGESFDVEFVVKQGKTTPPNLLTEADLIGLMEKHQIGTDATIHEHIKTIQDRKYALKQGPYFKPSHVGVALVETYNSIGIDLAKPRLRAQMERDMNEISKGKLSKAKFIEKYQAEMAEIYVKMDQMKQDFIQNLKKYININQDLIGEKDEPDEDGPDDGNGGPPPPGDGPAGPGNPGFVNPPDGRPKYQAKKPDSDLPPDEATGAVCECPYCHRGKVVLRSKKDGGQFLSCNGYPACQTSGGLPKEVKKAEATQDVCKTCASSGKKMHKLKLTFSNKEHRAGKYCLQCSADFAGYRFELRNKQTPGPSADTADRTTDERSYQAAWSVNDSHQPPPINNSNLKCYSCQQTGHLAHKCPTKQRSSDKTDHQTAFTDNSTQKGCFSCGLPGHFAANCPQKRQQPQATAKSTDEITCYNCKQQGHYSSRCPQKQK